MRTFIEKAKYLRTFWQFKDKSKRDRLFLLRIILGWNPRIGQWQ